MTIYLKQSTASQEIVLGPFVDSIDGVTAETGLTIANTDIKIWVAGATTLANKNSGGATHISGGIYSAVLDATDTATLGSLKIFVAVTGALACVLECVVLAANIYDSLIGGGDVLDVSVTQFAGSAITSAAGIPEVKVASLAAGSITATVVADGTIDAATFATGAITAAALAADAGAEIADAVWDEALAGHVTPGSAGEALGAASAAGDPWATVLPGFYAGGTAGSIIGNTLDVATSTLATAVTAAAIQAKTDSLTFSLSGQVDANIQSVNDVAVQGTGASGNEWRPV